MPARKLSANEAYEMYRIEQEALRRAEEKKRTEERKLMDQHAKKIGQFLRTLTLCGFVFATLAVMIVKYAALYEAQYQVNQLKSDIAQTKMDIEEVKSTLDSTVSLDNVERVAMSELGMQYPAPEQIIYIKGNWHYQLAPKEATGQSVAKTQDKKENLGGYVYDYILKYAFGADGANKASGKQ